MIDVVIIGITAFFVYKEAWWQGYAAGTEDFAINLVKQEEYELSQQREQE